ncbi:MAG: MFS transporter [Bacillota bacterium]|nr:MFS transporter [Bacillota bacterium]
MFAVNLAFSLGMGLYGFVMPAYARQLGATPEQFGALLSCAFALGTLAVIPGGAWADRYDRRTLMLIGWAMCLPAPLIFAWAKTWTWLIPGYACFFLSFFCNPAISAYVASIAGSSSSGAVWGTINSSFPLGFIVGPMVGGLLIRAVGIQWVFGCTFVCYLVSFLLLWTMSPQPQSAAGPVRTGERAGYGAGAGAGAGAGSGGPGAGGQPVPLSGGYRALIGVALLFAFFHVLLGVGPTYIALYLQDSLGLELSRVSVFGSAGALGGFLCAPLIGRLRDRRGARLAVFVALGLIAASNAGLLVLSSLVPLFFVLMMRGGENGMMTVGQAEIAARAPREELGRTFAGFHVLTGIGGTIGPYLGGALYGVDPRLPFAAMIVGAAAIGAVAPRLLAPSGVKAAHSGRHHGDVPAGGSAADHG